MSKPLSQRINTHQYPSVYFKYPFLIHIIYFFFRLVYQRVSITYFYLNLCLKKMPKSAHIVDAGFGEGQFLFRYAKRFPHLFFEGLDYNQNTLQFGIAYQKYFHLKNVSLQQIDLTKWKKTNNTLDKDGIFCVGVLHCIADDEAVLQNFYAQLKIGGWLLIYTPLRSRSILGFYRRTMQRFKTYDSTFRTQDYEIENLQHKLLKNGFSITQQRFTHGTMGILSYEIYTALITWITQGHFWAKIGSLLALWVLFPIILILKYLDIFFNNKVYGNAILIIAEKK